MKETTLCYIEQAGKYLMLYRNKKKNDDNAGKWIGVGGHIEPGETPLQCVKREVLEETGLTLKTCNYRGIVYFCSDTYEDETMHLFTADEFTGTLTDCNEGELSWIEKNKITELNLWEGDREFLKLLAEDGPFFRLRLQYRGEKLVNAEHLEP